MRANYFLILVCCAILNFAYVNWANAVRCLPTGDYDKYDRKQNVEEEEKENDDSLLVVERKRVVLKSNVPLKRFSDLSPDGKKSSDRRDENSSVVKKRVLFGREIADYRDLEKNGKYLLEDDYGYIRVIPNEAIVSVEDAPDLPLDELKESLQKDLLSEFGVRFSIKSSKRYILVYNSSDAYADWCLRLFESLADGFEKFAKHNELNLKERVQPMVVVVFATKAEFVQYASNETPNADAVAAYYNMETNRVVLYDLSGVEGRRDMSAKRKNSYQEVKEFLSRPNAEFNVATIVHEATHQIAFNLGLFQRSGPIALWTVEGLSLLFETPNGKASQGGWGYRRVFPVNDRQLAFFKRFTSATTRKGALRELVAQERFMLDAQDSYATSWAFFYYLYKKRPKNLAGYLNAVAEKPAGSVYTPEERVQDFEKFFGDDWEKITESLMRFVRKL